MTDREILAANIKRYRMAQGLSQEQLAEKSGLHRTYVGSIEQLKINIGIDSVEKIARALGVCTAALYLADSALEPVKNLRVARKHPQHVEPVVIVYEWNGGKPRVRAVTKKNAAELSKVVYRVVEVDEDDADRS